MCADAGGRPRAPSHTTGVEGSYGASGESSHTFSLPRAVVDTVDHSAAMMRLQASMLAMERERNMFSAQLAQKETDMQDLKRRLEA